MQDFQQRVVEEKKELDAKRELIERLREAHANSQQRCLGSDIFQEAADALSKCLEYKEALEWLGKYDYGLFPPVDEQDSWKVLTLKHAPLSFGPTPLAAIRNAMGKGE